MSQQFIYAILVSGLVFIALILVLRRFSGGQATQRRDRILSSIYTDHTQDHVAGLQSSASILRDDEDTASRILAGVPLIGEGLHDLAVKAGFLNRMSSILFGMFALFIILLVLLQKLTGAMLIALPLALVACIILMRFYLRRKIKKRNETFINMFPDAVDMIVRSVKSGHPLNTALKMIAENMDAPVSTEFRKLVDEIAYGRSTTEALIRLSKRIDEPDLQFFVVILSVQQETGGNLAEVLSNLSGIIRKRKQLRLKIKAMTSEGRATGLILGALPLVVLGAIQMTSPDYLTPLFITQTGHILLATALGLIGLTAFVVHNMLQIDI